MKKLFTLLIPLLFVLLLIPSCKEKSETASLRVELDKGSRTIAPEKEDMEIYGYRIIPVSPDGKEQQERITYYSYINLEGLSVGEWTIRVYGFSKDRKDLAYGEGKINLTSGKNTMRIEVKDLIGSGSLNLTFKWDETLFTNMDHIKLSLESQNGESTEYTPTTPVNGSSHLTIAEINSGSYTLTAQLMDENNNVLSGIAEAIRISNGSITESEIIFTSDPEKTGTGDVETNLSNLTAIPIEIKINGIPTLLEANKEIRATITILSPNLELKDLDVTWFMDGTEVSREINCVLPDGVREGMHRLDAIAKTKDQGSVGSTSIVFQSALSSSPGAIYQRAQIENGSEFTVGENAVVHFLPDNRLMIVSNQFKTVDLVNVSGSKPQKIKSFTFDSLGLEGEVVDFASMGDEDDSYFNIIFLCNCTGYAKAVNVVCSKNQLTKTDETRDFDPDTTPSRKANIFHRIYPLQESFIADIENEDKSRMGFVFFKPNAKKGEMIIKQQYLGSRINDFGYTSLVDGAVLSNRGVSVFFSSERAKAISFYPIDTNRNKYIESILWVDFDDYVAYYDI